MPVLFDFHLCRTRRVVNGVQTGGRSRLISHADLRARLLDNIVAPLLANYGHAPEIERLGPVQRARVGDLRGRDLESGVERLEDSDARFFQEAAARAHAVTRQRSPWAPPAR